MAGRPGLKEVKKHEPSQFTIEFSNFYQEIILKLYNVKDRKFLIDVKNSLKHIRQLHHDIGKWDEKNFLGIFSYTAPATRCAYMYAYSIINTSVVYCEFLKHLKDIESQSLQFFSGKSFRICCLGGGPGLEVIGMCRAINDVVWKSTNNKKNSLINIHVTIVDICPEWNSEASFILSEVNKSSGLFQPKRICFQVEYLQGDLLKPLDGAVKKAIQESDIVTIVKVVNTIRSSSRIDYSSKLKSMVKSVSNNMKEESCVFMLDTAGGNIFNAAMGKLPKSENSCCIVKLINQHKAYRLHPTVLQKFEKAIDFERLADISTLPPTALTKVSSCIWLKLQDPGVEEEKEKIVQSEN